MRKPEDSSLKPYASDQKEDERELNLIIKSLPIIRHAMMDAKKLQESKEPVTNNSGQPQKNDAVDPEKHIIATQTHNSETTNLNRDTTTSKSDEADNNRYHMYKKAKTQTKFQAHPTPESSNATGDTARRAALRDYDFPSVLEENYRDDWRRDHARVIHSPAFRRLQGKTQLFSTPESDYFRNRLTHSLEVAQIAKSIAIRLNNTEKRLQGNPQMQINPDIVEIAGLCHDLGHPPFAHDGEEALNECMRDFGGFEGNAQTLRILAVLEKRAVEESRRKPIEVDEDFKIIDRRRGLNLCYRTLASIMKYDRQINTTDTPNDNNPKVSKGYYECDNEIAELIKRNVTANEKSSVASGQFKTIECSIMDLADDIAYSTYDLEDSFKAGFLSPLELLSADDEIVTKVAETVRERCECFRCPRPAEHPEPEKDTGVTLKGERPKYLKLKDCQSPDQHGSSESSIKTKVRELWRDFVFKPMFDQPESAPDSTKPTSMPAGSNHTMVAYGASTLLSKNGYYRIGLVSELIGYFIRKTRFHFNEVHPYLSEVYLDPQDAIHLEILKNFTYESVIRSPRFRILRNRSREIVRAIFKQLASENGHEMLPEDIRQLYSTLKKAEENLKKQMNEMKEELKTVEAAEILTTAIERMLTAAKDFVQGGAAADMKEAASTIETEMKRLLSVKHPVFQKLSNAAENLPKLKIHQMRIICDFIASMTDRYAFEFHARLNSENAETVFKPL